MYYQDKHSQRNNKGRKENRGRKENPYIKIYEHTVEYCRKAKFPVCKPVIYQYDSDDFSDENILSQAELFNEPAMILVENIDSFDMARNLDKVSNTKRVMVLNLASDIRSGGGVKTGAKAQEEDLYRKSNYFEANSPNFYPLKYNEVIYSPSVHIIKDSSYKLLSNTCEVSCLAVAAIRNPSTHEVNNKKTYANAIDIKITQDKIDMIFKVAIKHEHTELVLGAIGCGAFHNPTEEIALMFKNSLAKYSKYFKKIGFAILSPMGNDNFDIFHKILME